MRNFSDRERRVVLKNRSPPERMINCVDNDRRPIPRKEQIFLTFDYPFSALVF